MAKKNTYSDLTPNEQTDMANLFNIYVDNNVDSYVYAINKTININGIPNPEHEEVTGIFQLYTANDGENWNYISYKLYGTYKLWWLLCKMNNVADPTSNLTGGKKLVYVSIEYVKNILEQLKSA